MTDHPVIPNIFANGPGNTADADLVNADFEYLRAWLDSRFGNATSAQLWVANASGVATPRTISGDVTVNNTGVTAIGAGKVTPAMLASPGHTAYKVLAFSQGFLGNQQAADTYVLGTHLNGKMLPTPPAMGPGVGGVNTPPPSLVRFVDTDYAVPNLTTKLNIRSSVSVNGTAPGITFNVKLYPVTVSGLDFLALTLGTAIAGSTSTHTTPGANAHDLATSGDFTIPANGVYILGVGTTAPLADQSAVMVSASVRYRNV